MLGMKVTKGSTLGQKTTCGELLGIKCYNPVLKKNKVVRSQPGFHKFLNHHQLHMVWSDVTDAKGSRKSNLEKNV